MRIRYLGALALLIGLASPAFAEKAEYTEQALQSAAVANGNGSTMTVDRFSVVAVDVTITGAATINFEGSVEGTNATAVTCTLTSTGAATQTATASGMYQCGVAGLKGFRARISGYASGTVSAYARATTAIARSGGGGIGAGTVTSIDAIQGVQTTTGSPITTVGTIRGAVLVNAQSGTTYTVVTGDRGGLVTFSNASPVAVTQPQAGGTFPSGWYVDFENRGAGTVTITPTTSTIDGAASIALATNSGIRVFSDGTNYFTQRGSGASAGLTLGSTPVSGGAASNFLYVAAGPVLQGVSITGLVLGNGASAPTAYAGVTCTNQVLRILSGTGAGTCVTLTSAYVDTSIWTGTASSGILKATSQGALATATAGTDYAGVGVSNTWADGVKQTFNPDNTNAGVNAGSNGAAPSAPANGDLYYDTGLTAFQFYQNGGWRGLGIVAETLDLQGTFALGKSITGANSRANAFRFGDGVTQMCAFTDATLGPTITPCTDANITSQIPANFTWALWDVEGAAAVETVDPDNGTKQGIWTYGTAYRPLKSVYFPAGGLNVDGTQCGQPTERQINSGALRYTIICADNDASTIYGEVEMPDAWDGGTVTLMGTFVQTAADTSNMNADVAMACRVDGDTINNTWGTEIAMDTAMGGSNKIDTVTTAAITPNGTCTGGGTLLQFRWQLDATGTTTAVATLHMLGFKLIYAVKSRSD